MASSAILYNQNWNDVMQNINPFSLASVGAALSLTMCVIGAAWYVEFFFLNSLQYDSMTYNSRYLLYYS